LEQADGKWELEGCPGYTNEGNTTDPFPGFLVERAFDDTTAPSSRDYSDNSTQVAVWNISDSDSVMYANLDVTWSRPNLAIDNFYFDDDASGDGDGRPEPDETAELYFAVSNAWKTLAGAWVIASADTDGISFAIDSVNLGGIPSGGTADNYADPVVLSVASGFPTRKVDFTLHICGDGGSYCLDLIQEADVGPTEILLVDDDNHTSGGSDHVAYYQAALDSLGEVYDVWDKQAKAKPSTDLSAYGILIWFTGDHRDSIFSTQDIQDLIDYLDGGGRLFLTSQDAVELLSGSAEPEAQTFLTDYLHVGYDGNSSKFLVAGRSGDEVGDALYIYPNYVVSNQSSKDNLVPDSEADTVLSYTVGGSGQWWTPSDSVAGTKFEDDLFKVVVFGFGFESMRDDGGYFQGEYCSQPHFVMERVLNWFRGFSDVIDREEESASLPKAIHLDQNYPNPFNPLTSIGFDVYSLRFMGGRPVHTNLRVYNLRGQLVRTLLDEEKQPGAHVVTWDGKDQQGEQVSSGIYFYRLQAGDESEVKKMVLLK
jgi:hypothetical protein